ncbi:MAG: DUF1194 domain-containing protein [Pseudomonadota bacterium]
MKQDWVKKLRQSTSQWILSVVFVALAGVTKASACSLALVLAMDVSASIDEREYRLQQDGLAQALADRDVMEAIRMQGGIWLRAFEWSGAHRQADWLDWTFIDTEESVRAAASKFAMVERSANEFPTALGYALVYAQYQLRKAPERCARKVIDVAGDGVNNDGFPPVSAYKAMDMEGITVNGLVIAGDTPSPVPYYQERVVYGPGSFLEVADGYEDYATAMRRKLLREIGAAYVQLR